MSYPEGTNLALNDSLPLAALPAKLLFQLTGASINPFGPWMFLTYVLQGAMAARLVYAVGVRSVWASVAAAVFAVANAFFLYRVVHSALSGQFLILWALALYFESVRQGRARNSELLVLLATSLLVNPYFFVMVIALESATIATLLIERRLPWRDLRILIAGAAAVAVLALVAGYATALTHDTQMVAIGYGRFSWNLVSLILPPHGFFGLVTGVTRDATTGQYEGESYLGLGALLLLVAVIVTRPGETIAAVRRHWVLTLALAALAAVAASNLVYFGGTQLLSFRLPPRVLHAASFFRAGGRFVWPLAYALALLPLAGIFRTWKAAPAVVAVSLAIGLQVIDAFPRIQSVRQYSSEPDLDLIQEPRFDSWLRQHHRVFQFPSFACGGLQTSLRAWGDTAATNREIQTQLAAARAGVVTNSVRVSRPLKDCASEAKWSESPGLEDGVLYLIAYEAIKATPALQGIADSSACERLEWWVACSTRWRKP